MHLIKIKQAKQSSAAMLVPHYAVFPPDLYNNCIPRPISFHSALILVREISDRVLEMLLLQIYFFIFF